MSVLTYISAAGRNPPGFALRFAFALAMLTPVVLFSLPSRADDPDEIAYVTGSPEQAAVHIFSLDSEDDREVGPCLPDARPAWSADGSTLVYPAARLNGPGSEIVWHRPEGDVSVRIGATFAHARHPALSPDGRFTAFEGYDTEPGQSALVVHDRETGAEQVWGGSRRALYTPRWLPNARLLLTLDPSLKIEVPGVDLDAIRQESGMADGSALKDGPVLALFAIGMDAAPRGLTSELLLVTRTQTLPVMALLPDAVESARYSEWNPQVSPGGSRVVFESDFGGDREIYQLDQRGLNNLTNHHAADWNPVWAENGRWFAFESFRDGRPGLYRMLADTQRTEPLTERPAWSATWAPDGERFACVELREGATRVVVYEVGKAADTVLPAERAWAPAWRPEP